MQILLEHVGCHQCVARFGYPETPDFKRSLVLFKVLPGQQFERAFGGLELVTFVFKFLNGLEYF